MITMTKRLRSNKGTTQSTHNQNIGNVNKTRKVNYINNNPFDNTIRKNVKQNIPTYNAREDLLGQKQQRKNIKINKMLAREDATTEILNIKDKLKTLKTMDLSTFEKFELEKQLRTKLQLLTREKERLKY